MIELTSEKNSGSYILCNGYFVDLELFKGLEIGEQKEYAPQIVEELEEYIESKKQAVSKAKKLNGKVYQFLSNKDLLTVLKKEWERRIKEANTTKSGKPRKQKITPKKEFEIKNQVIDEISKVYGGSIGIFNSYDFWNVQSEIHCTKAQEMLEIFKGLTNEEKVSEPDWLIEAQKELKINLGE